jgi:hypothetical protein
VTYLPSEVTKRLRKRDDYFVRKIGNDSRIYKTGLKGEEKTDIHEMPSLSRQQFNHCVIYSGQLRSYQRSLCSNLDGRPLSDMIMI